MPTDQGPLGDGASYASDVKPIEEEIATLEAHPEYGQDPEPWREALREAKADAAARGWQPKDRP